MKVQLIDCVRDAVDYIVSNENYKTPPEIVVKQGSEIGDGYTSKTYAISIGATDGKVIELFVKYLPKIPNAKWEEIISQAFRAELRFYREIYPAFYSFQDKKNVEAPFNNVPKHYNTNIENCRAPPIVLENLRCLGYTLRNRKEPVDDDHLRSPIIAFARYHAISYAMKDQEPELFRKLSAGSADFVIENFRTFEIDQMLDKSVGQFIDSLNPVSDKKLLDHCNNLSGVLIQHALDIPQNVDQYAVIGQGDCWSNNMMFLYDCKSSLPIDVKLIDWQYPRVNSPLLDFVYSFYTLATKEGLDNADSYLNLYYDTLSQRINELGSDPDKMYPREVFLTHWKKFSLFGLTMAFAAIKAQLFEKDEVPDLINSSAPSVDAFCTTVKRQDEYINRMKDLVEYFIDKELL